MELPPADQRVGHKSDADSQLPYCAYCKARGIANPLASNERQRGCRSVRKNHPDISMLRRTTDAILSSLPGGAGRSDERSQIGEAVKPNVREVGGATHSLDRDRASLFLCAAPKASRQHQRGGWRETGRPRTKFSTLLHNRQTNISAILVAQGTECLNFPPSVA